MSKNECLEKCFMEYLLSDRKNVLLKLSIHLQNILKINKKSLKIKIFVNLFSDSSAIIAP